MKRSSYGERDYTFGQAMLSLRTSIGLTQAGLAQVLGVSRRAVGEWEQGSSYPKAPHLQHLLSLAVRASAFPKGREEEEIRAFWKAAQQKVLLDEDWLAALLHSPSAPAAPMSVEASPQAQEESTSPPSQTSLAPASPSEARPPSAELVASRAGAPSGPRLDWGEALDVPSFYGREEELATLQRWVVQEHCRVVSVLGMGGVGKSALAVTLMRQVAPHFQVVLWRSLRDTPDCSSLLADCLRVLSPQPLLDLPASLEARLGLLLEQLGELRVLLVLDNLESVLQAGDVRGQFRSDSQEYARLLQALAQRMHQSCLLLTSREKPAVLRALESRQLPVRSLRLLGLSASACEQVLASHELLGSPEEQARLIERYEGNPLALHIVAEIIVELFGGEIAPFLAQDTLVFGSLSDLLAEQWNRLSPLEQTLLYWLATLREPVSIEEVQAALVTKLPALPLLEALDGLRRRSLVERGQRVGSFTLQSVVLEYATTHLVEELAREIAQGRLVRLIEQGLELATAKDYVRQTQTRLLVVPLLWQLLGHSQGKEAVESRLLALLSQLRERAEEAQGYAPANLLALLREQRGHLRDLDLSRLALRGTYLQGVEMQETSLAGARLREVAWTSAFDMILSVAVSPDGRYVAAGSNSGQVRVWREEGWVAHLTFQGHSDRVGSLAFSPDGRALATAGWDGSVKLWDLESGAAIWMAREESVPVTSIAISPSGKLISASLDGAIQMWDLRSGKYLARLHTQGGRIFTLAWSADGRLLASGGDDAVIRLWDGEQGRLLRELPGHRDLVCTLAFAPGQETSLLASGSSDQAVKLWDVETGACQMTLSGHTNIVVGLAWAPDGRTLASASHDTTIRLWDSQTGQCRYLLQGHRSAVMSLAFLPSGDRLLSGSVDRTLRMWDVLSGQQVRTMAGYALALYTLCWSPDGRFLVSGSSEAMLTLWEASTRRPVRVLRGHTQHVYAVAWSRAANRIVSGSQDQTVRLWDAQTGACTHILQGHNGISTVDWSPDGSFLASGSWDGSVRIWEMQEGTSRVISEPTGPVEALVWSPDGTLVAIGGDTGLVLVWRLTDGELLGRFEHAGAVGALCWSPTGEQLVSGSTDGEHGVVSIWEVRPGVRVRRLQGHRGFIWGLDWSAEHDLLLSAGADGTVRWWDPQQGVLLATVQAHQAWARAVRISPDGQTVASCGEDGTIGLWDLHSHQHLETLRADRPYERLDISHVRGLTRAQLAGLEALGAIGTESATPSMF